MSCADSLGALLCGLHLLMSCTDHCALCKQLMSLQSIRFGTSSFSNVSNTYAVSRNTKLHFLNTTLKVFQSHTANATAIDIELLCQVSTAVEIAALGENC